MVDNVRKTGYGCENMAEVFEKPVKQVAVLITDAGKARAIGDPIRSAILHVLSKKEGSIADIKAELDKKGIDIAPTTVRHHLEILKKAGLVELTRLVDSRGGMLKYYASNVRLIGHKAPEDFGEKLKRAIDEAGEGILEILKKTVKNHEKALRDTAKSLKPCPYCSEEHFMEYVVLEVMNRGTAKALEDRKFKAMLEEK
jgi:DNA-binding transcriptional ArsR family regulator